MKPETDIKEVPITIETAHQFFNKRQMAFIVKMFKQNYKEGFLNGRKLVAIFLFSIASFGQSSIVAAGNANETLLETFPIMQQDFKDKEASDAEVIALHEIIDTSETIAGRKTW